MSDDAEDGTGMCVDALVWRANHVDLNGDMMTMEALEDMVKALPPGTELGFDFDFRKGTAGHVRRAWIKGEYLGVSVVLDDPNMAKALHASDLKVRPGFSMSAAHLEDGHQVVDRVDAAMLSVMTHPMPLPGFDEDGSAYSADDS